MKKNNRPCVLFLEVTSWIGISIAADHFYGSVKSEYTRNKSGESIQKVNKSLSRLLSRKEAVKLNQKDSDSLGALMCSPYRPGQQTDRFNARADVVTAAIKYCKENHPNCFLLLGSVGIRSARPVLYWPSGFDTHATRLNELAKEWEEIGGYGGNETQAHKIDNEWCEILSPFFPTR